MQDAADEITLRDEEGTLRPEFPARRRSRADPATPTPCAVTLDLHEADLADLIQLLHPTSANC
jgi:hypothetical protein